MDKIRKFEFIFISREYVICPVKQNDIDAK